MGFRVLSNLMRPRLLRPDISRSFEATLRLSVVHAILRWYRCLCSRSPAFERIAGGDLCEEFHRRKSVERAEVEEWSHKDFLALHGIFMQIHLEVLSADIPRQPR